MSIPIIIICHNNHKYVDNTVKQLTKINSEYVKQINILDNKSTEIDTINYLKTVNVNVIYNEFNVGPWISNTRNTHIYNMMPDKFIITDPDLEYHKDIPSDFIEQLLKLSDKYNTFKIGMALDISEVDKMYSGGYEGDKTIHTWESQFWKRDISDDNYKLYIADIDTTFCLINKQLLHGTKIRVAGNFTAKHLPWYIHNPLLSIYELFKCYDNTQKISTISKLVIPHINHHYVKVFKNNELILIENRSDNKYLDFWKHTYPTWKNDIFNTLDTYLKGDKVFIDIGGKTGEISIYGSRKSKHVFVVETDGDRFEDLSANCKTNSSNITCINNTIKIQDILTNYEIDPTNISLIHIEIDGKEEDILSDLYEVYTSHHIPIQITFEFSKWLNKDLNRFLLLSDDNKEKIINNNNVSILFS